MARFTDIAKTAVSVQEVQTGPVPPDQTASTPLPIQPPGGVPAGVSAIAQGGMPTGLQAGAAPALPGGAAIRTDQPQPQPGMQTTQSLPQRAAPGAAKAFTPPKAPSAAPAAPKPPKPAAPAATKKSSLYPLKIATVLAPPAPGLLGQLAVGLGMHPTAFQGDGVNKALNGLEAFNRASSLASLPGMAADATNWVKEKVSMHGMPAPPPPGMMPESPAAQLGSFMDVVAPLKTPIQSTKNFLSGLGNEADRQLTQSMIEQPVTIHQLQFQNHPKATY